MTEECVIFFGFGQHSATVRTLSEAGGRLEEGAPGCALRVGYIPSPEQLREIVQTARPAMIILPPVSPYSHTAFAIWCSEVPVVATSELERFKDGARLEVDFDTGTIICAEQAFNGPAPRRQGPRRFNANFVDRAVRGIPGVLAEVATISDCERALHDGASGLGVIKVEQLAADATGKLGEHLADFCDATSSLEPLKIRYFDSERGLEGNSGPWLEPKLGLGRRGVRTLNSPGLLQRFAAQLQQLRDRDVMIVLPMVTSAAEVIDARSLLTDIGLRWSFGVTVETPAAALAIAEILPHASFVEIGVNDLTQYTLAWDRNAVNETLLPHDRLAEPVASLAREVLASCSSAGVYCTVGLDLRPNEWLAAQLIELGATSISCAFPLIRHWRRAFLSAYSYP